MVGEGVIAPIGSGVGVDAAVVWKQPGKDGAARRTAQRVGHDVVVEGLAAALEGDDVRHVLRRHETPVEVVGQHEYDVRPLASTSG